MQLQLNLKLTLNLHGSNLGLAMSTLNLRSLT